MENPPEQYTQKTFFNDLTALCEQAKAKGLTGPGVIGCLEMAKSVQVQSLVVVTHQPASPIMLPGIRKLPR
jgi:hypothetical protein